MPIALRISQSPTTIHSGARFTPTPHARFDQHVHALVSVACQQQPVRPTITIGPSTVRSIVEKAVREMDAPTV
jgi:hypothetical protein